MTLEEKKLYHQIHPLKLGTDFLSGFGAVYLLWERQLLAAVCLAFIPSAVLSLILVTKVDLEKYKNSAFGVYIRRHMYSKGVDWLRFGGFTLMMVGGWDHWWSLIGVGFLIVLACWSKGLIVGAFSEKKTG